MQNLHFEYQRIAKHVLTEWLRNLVPERKRKKILLTFPLTLLWIVLCSARVRVYELEVHRGVSNKHQTCDNEFTLASLAQFHSYVRHYFYVHGLGLGGGGEG